MKDYSTVLAASEALRAGRSKKDLDDKRLNAKHSRMNRSFVRQPYGDVEIIFYPLKRCPAVTGISLVTLRHWVQKSVLRVYYLHDMPVLCKAEMSAISRVTKKWWGLKDLHNATDPLFCKELQESLNETRTALDTLKRRQVLTPHQQTLLHASIEEYNATRPKSPR